MKWFVRFAISYAAIVCVLSWIKDCRAFGMVILFVGLAALSIKRGWVQKIGRCVFKQINELMTPIDSTEKHEEPFEVVWQTTRFIDGAQVRPLRFYEQLERRITERAIPKARFSRILLRESGPFSADREYLQVKRKDLEFLICGAPFGTGFFVSERLIKKKSLTFGEKVAAVFGFLLLASLLTVTLGARVIALWCVVAVIAVFYTAAFGESTSYEEDTAESFKRAVHNAVTETTDELMAIRPIGSLPIPDQPLMASLFH